MLPFCSAWDTDAWPYHDIQGGSIEELPLTTSRFAGTKNGSDDLLGLGRWCEAGELDWLILVVEENIVHISEGVDMYYIILCIIYRISVVIENTIFRSKSGGYTFQNVGIGRFGTSVCVLSSVFFCIATCLRFQNLCSTVQSSMSIGVLGGPSQLVSSYLPH